jgi:hypothetical protein
MSDPITVTLLKQRVGQRALLRVDATCRGNPAAWFVKLLRRSRAASEERRLLLRQISECAASAGIIVPAPIAYLPRFRALVFEAARGTSLFPCCAPPSGFETTSATLPLPEMVANASDSQQENRSQAIRSIGEALAKLHDRLPHAGEHRLIEFEREQIKQARIRLAQNRADLSDEFDQAVDDWWEKRSELSSRDRSRLVTIHGDFYPSQVLIDWDDEAVKPRLAFLDWDAACVGDGERDLGNFEAHMILEEIRGHLDAEGRSALYAAFEAGYRDSREISASTLTWYRKGSTLRLGALYADPSFGPSPPNPPTLTEDLLRFAGRDGA